VSDDDTSLGVQIPSQPTLAALRAPDEETRRREIEYFIEDLRRVAVILAEKVR